MRHACELLYSVYLLYQFTSVRALKETRISLRCVVDWLIAGKGDYGDVMLARVDGPDAVQQQQQQQCLVVVKSLLSSAAHHQRAFDHEAQMFSYSDCHVVRLLGVCCSLQPPLIVTEYCQLVSVHNTHCMASTYSMTRVPPSPTLGILRRVYYLDTVWAHSVGP